MTPAQYAILAIVAATVLGALVLFAVFAALGSLVRPSGEPDDDRTLVERARAIRPPRTAFGRVDRDFEDTVRGTLFGVTTERAIELILLVGGLFALVAFVFTEDWLVTLFALVSGMLLTVLVFAAFRNRRRQAIQEQLPDGCFQMARCLLAGLNLSAAVKESAGYSPQPLAGVLNDCHRRIEMGMTPAAAFERAAQDVRLTDFDLLAAVIGLHAEIGGNLPAMLDRLAATIRDRNQYRGYYRAVTSLARATTLFVALAAPVALLLTAVLQPEMFKYWTDPNLRTPITGWLILAAAVLWIVGVIWSLWLIRRNEEY